MSGDWFSKLREIDSLNKMRSVCLARMSEQEDRVSRLNERRQESLLQTSKLKQDLISTNTKLADIEARLKSVSEQRQRLIDYGGDEAKIKNFLIESENLEAGGLELLSALESIEAGIADARIFQEGLEKTISEINAEVETEKRALQTELENLNMRIKLSTDELPENFRQTLEKISIKKLAHGPFTRVDQGSCFFCRFKISRIDESEIDMQKNLKTCPQCSRIFLPYGA